MSKPECFDVAIIGGGFSGTMVAVNIIRRFAMSQVAMSSAAMTSVHGGCRVRINLIERSESVGRGMAYGTEHPRHLLNVRAANMSALPDEPDHFVHWLRSRQPFEAWSPPSDGLAEAYAPRRIYGLYVQDLLRSSLESAPRGVEFNHIRDEAVAIDPREGCASIRLRSGNRMQADQVVLALGNLPPKDVPGLGEAILKSPRYEGSPWSKQALDGLGSDEPVLFVGAGLTMVDLAISLHLAGHRGLIHAVSRRGLLPQAHAPAPTIKPFIDPSTAPRKVPSLLRLIRRKAADPQNHDWRSVINSLRADTTAIWRALPLVEQKRFLRHVQTYWDLHRHRMSRETATLVEGMKASGQLTIRAGRIVEARDVGDRLEISIRERRTGGEVKLTAARLINCTGSTLDLQHLRHDLLRQLLSEGYVRPDPLGLGLDVDLDGACIDSTGSAPGLIYTLGPLRKGTVWETTAVPEIRAQAAELAGLMLQSANKINIMDVMEPEWQLV